MQPILSGICIEGTSGILIHPALRQHAGFKISGLIHQMHTIRLIKVNVISLVFPTWKYNFTLIYYVQISSWDSLCPDCETKRILVCHL